MGLYQIRKKRIVRPYPVHILRTLGMTAAVAQTEVDNEMPDD